MSVVIVGGNECMERRYIDTCKEYGCKAKVFTKMKHGIRTKFGSPDLIILFTGTVSHKMIDCVKCEAKKCDAKICRSHSSSLSALKSMLDEFKQAN